MKLKLTAFLVFIFFIAKGQNTFLPDAYNVQWNVPGPGSAQSMPLGNGDIGLNVWVEKNGDLAFYISKTDAWGGTAAEQDPWMKQGGVLMKLGLVHISLKPAPVMKSVPFLQLLKLSSGEIEVTEGDAVSRNKFRIWVDANHPVIRVEAVSRRPVKVEVRLENWRTGKGDTILSGQHNRITWYHMNDQTEDPHLAGLTFGATIKGTGLVKKGESLSLQSAAPVTSQLISVYPLTTKSAGQWETQLNKQVTNIDQLQLEQARKAHDDWWNRFWQRSWVYIHGDKGADEVTRGYILQRFITACAGRGKYPIKFNGSVFTVDNPAWKAAPSAAPEQKNADFRAWGGQYWFQNTRAMYWPRLMAGDFDLMMPLFRMYADMLPENQALVKKYYGHGGVYFAETAPFWGGLPDMGPDVKASYTNHYFTPVLELSMMMLDYYAYTGDQKFAREILLPVATAGLEFFSQHFGRDAAGKILLDPDNAIEMFWKVHNPAPDIAGLHAVLNGMIALPANLTDAAALQQWKEMKDELPALPSGLKDGSKVLLPYTGEQTAKSFNSENPELYAVYPFRLYGLGKPDLQVALNTFKARKFTDKGCWVQDPVQAAMLGLSDVAKDYVTFTLTRKDPRLKFPAFWAKGNDYEPDQDNGGNGENGLQQMLMQTDGKKIRLLPAWPENWDADFKLNAPYRTTVQGKVSKGKLVNLTVIPADRRADVIDAAGNQIILP